MVNNSLQKKKAENTFSGFLTSEGAKKKINEIIGGKNGQRFITAIVSAVSNNPMLQECENTTILSGALLGESLGLSPSPQLGHYYLVPFNDRKNNRKVATFQLGYKGYIQLAMRSGGYKDIDTLEIKEGEYRGRDKNSGKQIFSFIEDDDERESKETIGYMAYFELSNGFFKRIYWTKEKMKTHALQYSQSYKSDIDKGWKNSFWSKDFDAMSFKTLIRSLISKWGIMSIEMQGAIEQEIDAESKESDYVEGKETETATVEAEFFDAPNAEEKGDK